MLLYQKDLCIRHYIFRLFEPLLCSGGRIISVSGQNLDVVQEPKMRVTLSPPDTLPPRRRRKRGGSTDRRSEEIMNGEQHHIVPLKRRRRIVPEMDCPDGTLCQVKHVSSYRHTDKWTRLPTTDCLMLVLVKHGEYFMQKCI